MQMIDTQSWTVRHICERNKKKKKNWRKMNQRKIESEEDKIERK